jgi:hypothetical protein
MSDFSSPYTAIDYGKDFNYFNKLSVNITDGYFPTNCQILIPFSTYTVTFQLESGGPLEYSFNGITVHGDMTSTLPSNNLVFENRVISKIWFRGSGTVRIEAWGIR